MVLKPILLLLYFNVILPTLKVVKQGSSLGQACCSLELHVPEQICSYPHTENLEWNFPGNSSRQGSWLWMPYSTLQFCLLELLVHLSILTYNVLVICILKEIAFTNLPQLVAWKQFLLITRQMALYKLAQDKIMIVLFPMFFTFFVCMFSLVPAFLSWLCFTDQVLYTHMLTSYSSSYTHVLQHSMHTQTQAIFIKIPSAFSVSCLRGTSTLHAFSQQNR